MKNEQLTFVEHERQKSRMRGFLTNADAKVWSNNYFPSEHRPNVAFLAPRIRIEGLTYDPTQIHPGIKPSMLEGALETEQEVLKDKSAWLQLPNRDIIIPYYTLRFPDKDLRRILFHEAATDAYFQPVRETQPDKYNSKQREFVLNILSSAFQEDKIPTIDETILIKRGFLEYLSIDGYDIAYQGPEIGMVADEVYPTIHEIITDHLVDLNGDFELFEQLVQQGSIRPLSNETHPIFAIDLFDIIRFVNWRDILSAFKTGDIDKIIAYIDQHGGNGYGENMAASLIDTMIKSEEQIKASNALARSTFPRLKY